MLTINEQFAARRAQENKQVSIEIERVPETVKQVSDEYELVLTKPRIVEPSSFGVGWGNGSAYSNTGYVPISRGVFNGEKTIGALGNPMDLRVNPVALRMRAYEAVTTSDVVNMIVGKFFKWVVGTGLKMQAEPKTKVLDLEKVKEDIDEFKDNVEAYFDLFASSERSDYSGMDNLHLNAQKALETSFVGGDCLVICRVDENNDLSTQVIDGQHIINPLGAAQMLADVKGRGNMLFSGIEMNDRGKHIAYYVRKQAIEGQSELFTNSDYVRIEAYGKDTKCLMAWMVYGKKNRIDHHRGISCLSAILEKVTKLDRYTEATVATAEERSKMVWTVVHGKTSTGENPLISGPRARNGLGNDFDNWAQGQLAANQIKLTTDRDTINMPVDSELKAVSSQSEINYEPFFKAIFIQLCAAVDIPPEVALQKYESNYSASRAAIKSWEYIIKIYRKKFSDKFYQPFYDLWLYIHILKGKVKADKYLEGKNAGNRDIVEAYSVARFTGANMPNIDPKKEADAIRIMLGIGDQSPLITHEDAAEQLGNGDWNANIVKNQKEKDKLLSSGFEDEVNPLPPVIPSDHATAI